MWLLIIYTLFVLYFTTFGRRSWGYYRYDFNFLNSYKAAFLNGDTYLCIQILLNIFMFIPVGVLGSFAFKRLSQLKAMLWGILLTSSVELLQLVMMRGTFEYDDMLSNSIGTAVGIAVGLLIRLGRSLTRKNKQNITKENCSKK